jgi:hypothetical protein
MALEAAFANEAVSAKYDRLAAGEIRHRQFPQFPVSPNNFPVMARKFPARR